MKHLLMDPAFPDIVGGFAAAAAARDASRPPASCANDNADHLDREIADPLFVLVARQEIAATRLW